MNPDNPKRRWLIHLTTLALIGVFAVLGAGTTGSDEDGGGDDSEEASPGAAQRRDLEGHFSAGQAYGDGPGGAQMAQSMSQMLDQTLGDTLVLRVLPGNPERIVALLRLRDLRDFSDSDRQEWLDNFGETIREGYAANDSQIVVGIRGNVFYGAVAVMTPSATDWSVETGTMVSTGSIDEALAPAPVAALAGAVRQDVYGDIAANDQPYARDEYSNARADRIPANLTAGQMVTIHMASPTIDSYLVVLGPDGAAVAQNDDSGGTLNSMVNYTPTATGAHTIVATTYDDGDVGPYVVRVRQTGGGAAAPAAPAQQAPAQ